MDTQARIKRLKFLVNRLWTDTEGALTYNDINININAITSDIEEKDKRIEELEKLAIKLGDRVAHLEKASIDNQDELLDDIDKLITEHEDKEAHLNKVIGLMAVGCTGAARMGCTPDIAIKYYNQKAAELKKGKEQANDT